MAQENAVNSLKLTQQDEALKAKFKAITDPESFIKIAENRGYNFAQRIGD